MKERDLTPTNMLSALRNRIFDVFDDVSGAAQRELMGETPAEGEGETRAPATSPSQTWNPAIDVVDEDERVRVRAELPGLKPDDFTVEVENDRLYIRGEKQTRREEKRGDVTYSEVSYGRFSRALRLPADVVADKAEASYENGVLELTLPKQEESRRRRVRVDVK
jgi:HSP20 family molecular chaperone IbpA